MAVATQPVCSLSSGKVTVQLPSWTAEVAVHVEGHVSLRDAVTPAACASWPVMPVLSTETPLPRRPARVGSLWWPPGASRFAVAHFFATDATLAQLRPLVYGKTARTRGTEYNALTLRLGDGRFSISTDLYLLPPRPLSECAGANNGWLLTLVDERFFWWQRAANVLISPGSTTWAALIASIASALDVTITPDSIDSAYLFPGPGLAGRYDSLPLLLDAACAGCGHVLVRKLDGTVVTQSARTALAAQDSQLRYWNRQGGGAYALDAEVSDNDLQGLVPAEVQVVFPWDQGGGVDPDAPHVVTKTLASLSLPEFSGVTGRPEDTPALHNAALASGAGAPANATELAALATALAEAYYLWQLGRQAVAYIGVAPYVPEALSEITWQHGHTRVERTTHEVDSTPGGTYGTYGSGPVVVNTSVVYTGTVTFIGVVTTTDIPFTPTGYVGTDLEITATTATITTNQNNYPLPGTSYLKVNTTAGPVTITGIVAPPTNATYYITNNGPGTLTLANQNVSSTAINRFVVPGGADLLVPVNQTAVVHYNVTLQRFETTLVPVTGSPNTALYNLTGSKNNLTLPVGVKVLAVDPDNTGYSITGIVPTAGYFPGTEITIVNTGGSSFTLANLSASSSFGNQIYTTTGGDLLIPVGKSATLLDTGTYWTVKNGTAVSGGTEPTTTKGDLSTYSTVPDRLPVGANGFFLSADSGETTGLKWVAAPSGTISGLTPGQIVVAASSTTLGHDPNIDFDDAVGSLTITNIASGRVVIINSDVAGLIDDSVASDGPAYWTSAGVLASAGSASAIADVATGGGATAAANATAINSILAALRVSKDILP